MIVYKLQYESKELALEDLKGKEIIGNPVFIEPTEVDENGDLEIWNYCLVDVICETEQTFNAVIKTPEIPKHNFL